MYHPEHAPRTQYQPCRPFHSHTAPTLTPGACPHVSPTLPCPGPQDPSAPPPAASSAAEELLQELCCQTWRVELDYGLQGAEAQPVDRLLLACSG